MKYIFIGLTVVVIVGCTLLLFFIQTNSQTTSLREEEAVINDVSPVDGVEYVDTLPESDPSKKVEKVGQASITLDPNARVFTIQGVNYGFDVQEIKVKKGDTVTINFESTDGFHDWVVDAFSASTNKVQPGVPTSVTFTADKTGTFEYYSSVGNQKDLGMVGTLIVEDSE